MIYIVYKLFELYTMKVVRTVLSGGKFVKIYLSQLSHWGNINIASNIFNIIKLIYIIMLILLIYIFYTIIIRQIIKTKEYLILIKSIDYINKNKYIINLNITNKKDINNNIGPLNIDILSIIYGSILGDGHAEKRKGGKGTRIVFQQEYCNINYLYYLHSLLANLGYCNTNLPLIKTRLGKKGKIRQYLKFNTWTYDSFNMIYSEWYIKNISGKGNIKVIPKSLDNYLTPLALAIWIIDDGCKLGKGLKFTTNCFSYKDVQYLLYLLHNKYNIKTTIHKGNKENTQFVIYVWKESIPILTKIVSPYIIPSIKYKLGNYL